MGMLHIIYLFYTLGLLIKMGQNRHLVGVAHDFWPSLYMRDRGCEVCLTSTFTELPTRSMSVCRLFVQQHDGPE